ncbi:hypothetical protein [Paraburkholderia sp. Ac-20347]|jgi:hypothetical protein|uniref:hypothetical protein n=1 Tax=Paraburkholderia sp. Ac-20347 TaxID=2703892 RepID=UPI00197E1C5D|nr:hypothetical protein [Paraburkholderia sp. Ac-20347]MBN3808052.1 hypothetical protein [Paraburkholderia sp. Ac-20347]
MFVKHFLASRSGAAALICGGMALSVALAAVLCASVAAREIDRALRLSWWFS